MSPILELFLCAAGVGILFLILDYRPAPLRAQAIGARQERQQRQELEAHIREFMTLTPEDLEVLEQQSAEQLYIARKTNWRYHRELRANLGICSRRRKKN